MKYINVREEKVKKKKSKIKLLPLVIISILLSLLFVRITQKSEFDSGVKSVFSFNRNLVNYDTYSIYLGNISDQYSERITKDLEEIEFEGKKRFSFVDNKERADFILDYGSGDDYAFVDYLIPVGHFYWIRDSIKENELVSGDYSVILSKETYRKYSGYIKEKYEGLDVVKSDNLVQDLSDEDCGCIGLITNNEIKKDFRILLFNDKYYLDTFDGGLKIPVVLISQDDDLNTEFVANIIYKNTQIGSDDYNENTITKINMTGTTAITRHLGRIMDTRKEYDYPAQRIGSFLADADITHVSNEVSFVEGCTSYSGTRFCSRPEYMETLIKSGVNLVELTGNHNNDYGRKYATKAIEMYKEQDMNYFGGGLNEEDASKPFITEIKGSKIGFLGYNYYDSMLPATFALATENQPGANSYSDEKMKRDIEKIRNDVDIVIVTFQFQECYSYPPSDVIYPICYRPVHRQKDKFRLAVDYGADIVMGSQAHQPQTYEIYNGKMIFYGLGNLFFDQSRWIGTRHAIVVSHYMKDGKLIQSRITPTIYDRDLQVEVADEKDATLLLDLLKTARKSL